MVTTDKSRAYIHFSLHMYISHALPHFTAILYIHLALAHIAIYHTQYIYISYPSLSVLQNSTAWPYNRSVVVDDCCCVNSARTPALRTHTHTRHIHTRARTRDPSEYRYSITIHTTHATPRQQQQVRRGRRGERDCRGSERKVRAGWQAAAAAAGIKVLLSVSLSLWCARAQVRDKKSSLGWWESERGTTAACSRVRSDVVFEFLWWKSAEVRLRC